MVTGKSSQYDYSTVMHREKTATAGKNLWYGIYTDVTSK